MDSSQTTVTIVNAAFAKIGVARITSLADTTNIAAIRANDVYGQLRDYCLAQHFWTFAKKTVLLTPMVAVWATNTSYGTGSFVVVSGVVYICLIAHTSSNFTTDLADGNWQAYNWTTATDYTIAQYVNQGWDVYVCVVPHTAGTFSTDLAAGYWIEQTNLSVSIPNFGDGVCLAYLMPTDWIRPHKWNFPEAIKYIEKNIIYSDTPGLGVKYVYANNDPTLYTPEFIEAFSTKIAAELCYTLTQNAEKGKELLDEFQGNSWGMGKLDQAIAADSQADTPDQILANEWEVAKIAGAGVLPVLPGQITFFSPGVQ